MRKTDFLVVDDDDAFIRIFTKLCAGTVTVAAATTIDSGIALAREVSPSYVFLDVRFDGPWRTGIDAIAEMRAAAPSARVVVMTSLVNEYDRERALALGASAYVLKSELMTTNGAAYALRAIRLADRQAPRRSSAAAKACRPGAKKSGG
jgi:DNA-binding NarL/FixJ family response regulator